MLIGELSKRAGVTPRTVRYYEDLGLLNPPVCAGGFQTYRAKDLVRLTEIAGYKQLGLSLEEIYQVITVCSNPPDDLENRRAALAILEAHLERTVQKLDDLERFRGKLEGMVGGLREFIQHRER